MNKFMVFNPLIGQYEYADTKEAAIILKDKITNAFIASHVTPLIDVQEEITDANGSKTSTKIII